MPCPQVLLIWAISYHLDRVWLWLAPPPHAKYERHIILYKTMPNVPRMKNLASNFSRICRGRSPRPPFFRSLSAKPRWLGWNQQQYQFQSVPITVSVSYCYWFQANRTAIKSGALLMVVRWAWKHWTSPNKIFINHV